MRTILKLFILLIIMSLTTKVNAQTLPPGVVIDYMSVKNGIYIGSPGICILDNGDYIVVHDEFGPKSTETKSAKTIVLHSTDKGLTWKKISQINGQFWSTLFMHKGALYVMGTNKGHGNVVIRRSTDNGKSWTNPYDAENGLLVEGEYHTAPVPVIVHDGRIWRAVEYATAKSDKWPERYSAVMLSAPVNADLLQAKNWTRSNTLYFDANLLPGGNFLGWLEGNAVVDKGGKMVNVLRLHIPAAHKEYAAILNVDKKGKKIWADTTTSVVEMPGGSKKFTIRYDPPSALYWTIVNDVKSEYKDAYADRTRNSLALASSPDLRNWTLHEQLLVHPDPKKHGFQYIDWVVEGDDIVFVSRTAYDDADGGAGDYHNANYLTFHRINNFRALSNKKME